MAETVMILLRPAKPVIYTAYSLHKPSRHWEVLAFLNVIAVCQLLKT